MRIFSSATAKSVQGIISQLSKSMLGFSVVPNPVELLRWKAVYLPTWIWKARVKGTAKRDASPGGNAPPDQAKPNAMITINFGKGCGSPGLFRRPTSMWLTQLRSDILLLPYPDPSSVDRSCLMVVLAHRIYPRK